MVERLIVLLGICVPEDRDSLIQWLQLDCTLIISPPIQEVAVKRCLTHALPVTYSITPGNENVAVSVHLCSIGRWTRMSTSMASRHMGRRCHQTSAWDTGKRSAGPLLRRQWIRILSWEAFPAAQSSGTTLQMPQLLL